MATAAPRRKPGPPSRFGQRVSVMVSPEQYQQLEGLAEREQVSMSALVRRTIQQLLDDPPTRQGVR